MLYKLIKPSIIQENLMHNAELVLQFLDLYRDQIPKDIQVLKDAVLAGTYSAIANQAHHIKPTMEYIGAHALREKLQQLENGAKTEVKTAEILAIWTDIEKEIHILLLEISDYRNKL
ncbi:Hpt domain-containing protein [Sphingobacterium sp. FBM7-1]|uniref:Hpt domain-containing protein n=1 Tax=Sphingobacterium sp. FBM7-1 TaxID=2886688 RepID=UPI001D0FA1F2|nr:Hpt domain-containing protein [Sphingobacterium sp. FBM7-1]MCC2600228.1 Hpt domain-containing protein [Sphingobacterium sp. FBM7-1]